MAMSRNRSGQANSSRSSKEFWMISPRVNLPKPQNLCFDEVATNGVLESGGQWAVVAGNQSRNARTGSIRVARQAGKKHAAREAMVITTNADPKASGSRGLTLYKRFLSNRVNASDTAAPSKTPPAVNPRPRDITSRNRLDAPAPSAMRSPNSRVLCDTAYDITP